MLNVIINGANGKMGSISSQFLSQQSDIKVVAALSRHDDLIATIKNTAADIVVDFTTPQAVFENAKNIITAGARPVVGTTGLKNEQIQELQTLCASLKRGGIIAPSFSIGAILMMRFAKEAAKYFQHAEIIEMHHQHKKDSPSGTAIKTAEMMSQQQTFIAPTSEETLSGASGARIQNIPIHSVRLPGLLAHQMVLFGEQGETLTIRHDTIDRSCYMPGLLTACHAVMQLNELIYGLENIL